MKIRTAAQFAAAHNAWLESPDDDPHALAIEAESEDVADELSKHIDAIQTALSAAKKGASFSRRRALDDAIRAFETAADEFTAAIAEARLERAEAGRDGL